MGDNIYPLTKSAMMSPVLFLLPILLCVAQAEPEGKWFLIDTVDNEENGGRADDYDINHIGGWPSMNPWSYGGGISQTRDPCISVNCNFGPNNNNNKSTDQNIWSRRWIINNCTYVYLKKIIG